MDMFSFLVSKNPGVEWLGLMKNASLHLQETAKLFSKVLIMFCIFISWRVSVAPHPPHHIGSSVLLPLAGPVGGKMVSRGAG